MTTNNTRPLTLANIFPEALLALVERLLGNWMKMLSSACARTKGRTEGDSSHQAEGL